MLIQLEVRDDAREGRERGISERTVELRRPLQEFRLDALVRL